MNLDTKFPQIRKHYGAFVASDTTRSGDNF
jgi:hypothetical protein